MDILILGNGFDLAHSLKTRYTDFLDYWRKNNGLENVWLKHFVNRQKQLGDKWIDLEEEIYNVIEEINKIINRYNKDFVSVLYIFSRYYDKNFDLSKMSNGFNESPNRDIKNEKEYEILDINGEDFFCYFKTYKGLVNFLYDQLRDFTNQFNKYLSDQVLPNISNSQYEFGLSLDKTIRVLNFNYTDTFKILYNPLNIYSNHKYIFVHGKICNSKDCDLVLGTKSFNNNEISVEFNVFKKHNQRHKYGTIEAYQALLKELKDKRRIIEPTFHVIGHSLDEADHNILRHIFKVRENSTIKIYYHNQEALERLINNITEIIGEEEVTAKVRFIQQHDLNKGILIP